MAADRTSTHDRRDRNPPAPSGRTADAHPVWDLLSRVRIAHHISGRIRLKLDLDLAASGFRLPSADALKQANAVLQRLPGIAAVRINPYARSCLIEYDPEQIPDAAWSDLLTGHDSAATATLQRLIAETLEERAVQAVVQEALPVPDRQ